MSVMLMMLHLITLLLLKKYSDMVVRINKGLEKWLNIRMWFASSSVILPFSYNIFVFLALDGNPDIILNINIVTKWSLMLNIALNAFFIDFGIYCVTL